MPLFYFELDDTGDIIEDLDGVEFETSEQAYSEAVATLSEMAKDFTPIDGPRTLKMTICDSSKRIVGTPELSYDPSGLFGRRS